MGVWMAGVWGGLGHWSLCCAKGEFWVSWPGPRACGWVRWKAEVVWWDGVWRPLERLKKDHPQPLGAGSKQSGAPYLSEFLDPRQGGTPTLEPRLRPS